MSAWPLPARVRLAIQPYRRMAIRNPLVRENLKEGTNLRVLALGALFNVASVHQRRALLRWAAVFAGTVPADVANELGQPAPRLAVRPHAATGGGTR